MKDREITEEGITDQDIKNVFYFMVGFMQIGLPLIKLMFCGLLWALKAWFNYGPGCPEINLVPIFFYLFY